MTIEKPKGKDDIWREQQEKEKEEARVIETLQEFYWKEKQAEKSEKIKRFVKYQKLKSEHLSRMLDFYH